MVLINIQWNSTAQMDLERKLYFFFTLAWNYRIGMSTIVCIALHSIGLIIETGGVALQIASRKRSDGEWQEQDISNRCLITLSQKLKLQGIADFLFAQYFIVSTIRWQTLCTTNSERQCLAWLRWFFPKNFAFCVSKFCLKRPHTSKNGFQFYRSSSRHILDNSGSLFVCVSRYRFTFHAHKQESPSKGTHKKKITRRS